MVELRSLRSSAFDGECWNIGMMGLNEFYRFYKKDLFRFYTQYSDIPSFHYSMLHCNVERQLKTKISRGRRIDETLINF
jgi:hypothetical protein